MANQLHTWYMFITEALYVMAMRAYRVPNYVYMLSHMAYICSLIVGP